MPVLLQKDPVVNICQAADKQLFTLVEWAKNIPHFTDLPLEDQVILLRAGQFFYACMWSVTKPDVHQFSYVCMWSVAKSDVGQFPYVCMWSGTKSDVGQFSFVCMWSVTKSDVGQFSYVCMWSVTKPDVCQFFCVSMSSVTKSVVGQFLYDNGFCCIVLSNADTFDRHL